MGVGAIGSRQSGIGNAPSRSRLFVAVFAAVWLALAAAEVYHLVDPFTYPYPPCRRPLGVPTPYRRLKHATNVGDSGGDLTRMLGFRLGTGLFAVPRGDIEVWTDRRGYRNEPRLADAHCPVVVTGDSFMDQGLTNADTPAGVLAGLLGVPVYDHTHMARGPRTGITAFLHDDEFRRKPPKVLVWGFVERSTHAGAFPTYKPPRPAPTPTLGQRLRTAWDGIRLPETDRRSYRYVWTRYSSSPKWSLLRGLAVAVKAEATWRLTGRFITDKVLVGERPDGQFALFLRSGVRGLARSARQRRLDKAADGIASYHAECARRGIHLVVLLIPDKAHVYRRWLKPADRPKLPTPDALTDLDRRLVARGIHAVNLLPVYLAHNADTDPPLYYPDDTHWNEHGIRTAMHALAASLATRGIDLKQ